MIFKATNNQIVELKITNYQFPISNDTDWDGNWLNIYLRVTSQIGNWQTIDPSLATWEVQKLIDWFQNLADKQPIWNDLEFVEPNLSFHLLNDYKDNNKKIRIKFNLESRPKSATDDKEYFIDFEADDSELKRITIELTSELKKFPIRK